jgi:hypothetical protein
VKLVLEEQFGVSVRFWAFKKMHKPTAEITLPKVTGDVFLCQLALIANINKKTFYKFAETVRENYPEILVYYQAGIKDFYKTPNIDCE